jgi:hypothetical protein
MHVQLCAEAVYGKEETFGKAKLIVKGFDSVQ